MSEFTVYRTHIVLIPANDWVPEMWHVELISHNEDGPQVEFVGDYFSRDDADTIAATWRHEPTRKLVWLAAALQQPRWHDNQGDTE